MGQFDIPRIVGEKTHADKFIQRGIQPAFTTRAAQWAEAGKNNSYKDVVLAPGKKPGDLTDSTVTINIGHAEFKHLINDLQDMATNGLPPEETVIDAAGPDHGTTGQVTLKYTDANGNAKLDEGESYSLEINANQYNKDAVRAIFVKGEMLNMGSAQIKHDSEPNSENQTARLVSFGGSNSNVHSSTKAKEYNQPTTPEQKATLDMMAKQISEMPFREIIIDEPATGDTGKKP